MGASFGEEEDILFQRFLRTRSFKRRRVFDLTQLATYFDPDEVGMQMHVDAGLSKLGTALL